MRICGRSASARATGDALLLTAGQLLDELVLVPGEPDLLECGCGGLGDLLDRPAGGAKGGLDVLDGGEEGDQAVALQHDGDLVGVRPRVDAPAVEAHGAAVGFGEPGQEGEQAGLAAAGRPHDRDALPRSDDEADVVEDHPTVALVTQALRLEDRHRSSLPVS